jgi:hypothetical protein
MMMHVPNRALLLAGALLTFGMADVQAQTDYRNLDDERPVRTEDAWPIERRAWEWMAPFRYARHDGRGEFEFTPELMWGAFANGMVGAKLPVVTNSRLGEAALAGPRLFALLSLNAETRTLPGFALRADAILPGGEAAGDATLFTAKAIATRTWGRLRTHVNALVTIGDAMNAPRADAPGRWSATLAADWSFVRQSTLVIAELATEKPLAGNLQQWEVAVGLRRQLTPDLVLDAGLSRGIGGGAGPDLAFTAGLSRSFAIGTPSVRRTP